MRILPDNEKRIKLNNMLWVTSLNPLFPVIHRFFRYTIPLVELCFFTYIILFSFQWKKKIDAIEGLTD
jgi:hypothetical protein